VATGTAGPLRQQALDEGLPLSERVLACVDLIPPGRVMSYKDVSEFVFGHPRSPRRVARVLSRDSVGSGVPWWRVIRADGSCATPVRSEQLRRLAEEGVPIRNEHVVMAAARWDGR